MIDPVDELKTRAEILHKRVAAGDVTSQKRLRALRELAKVDDAALAAAAANVQRKHCLAVVSREHGFTTWEHAQRVLRGWEPEPDVGTLLYDRDSGGGLNVWFADYEEARGHLDEMRRGSNERWLLAYKRHFFVVDRFFIEALGLDPDDSDWAAIDFDWARPRDPVARRRLYGRRLAVLRRRS